MNNVPDVEKESYDKEDNLLMEIDLDEYEYEDEDDNDDDVDSLNEVCGCDTDCDYCELDDEDLDEYLDESWDGPSWDESWDDQDIDDN